MSERFQLNSRPLRESVRMERTGPIFFLLWDCIYYKLSKTYNFINKKITLIKLNKLK